MSVNSWIRALKPQANLVSGREILRSGMGALLGILVTALAGYAALRAGWWASPALVAPMGASAVLLFAVPSSPLAQPWSILGGNSVAAIIGVTVAMIVPEPAIACAIAIGLAIPAMMALRCLHPPSGAIALTAVLGGPGVHDLGYGFVIWPVAGNSLCILLAALVFNRAVGRRYPNIVKPSSSQSETAASQAGNTVFRSTDLDEVISEYDQFLDINREELETILRRTELRAYRRRTGQTECRQIMARNVTAVAPDASMRHAQDLMRRHHVKALPVTDDNARVIGIVTQTDLLDKALWTGGKPTIGLARRLSLALTGASAPNGTVKDIMTMPVRTVSPQAPVAEAIEIFSDEGLHYLPVTDERGRLVGMVAQSDAMTAMVAEAQHTTGDKTSPVSNTGTP